MILVTFLLSIWINGLANNITLPYDSKEDCEKSKKIYLKKTMNINTGAVCVEYHSHKK
jgi:hypothetical protein